MTILSELQNKELGLIRLISMGFDIYQKNLRSILLIFCTIYLPFLIIMSAFTYDFQDNPDLSSLGLFYVILIVAGIVGMIFYVAASIITVNYLHGRNTSYKNVKQKILSSLFPLCWLSFIFLINYILRCFLLLIPGIIYLINNQYYILAFVLRDERGGDTFSYSRSVVEGDWWKVFFFYILNGLFAFALQFIFSISFDTIPFINEFWVYLLSQTLPSFIVIGMSIASVLLFLNMDFLKNTESIEASTSEVNL